MLARIMPVEEQDLHFCYHQEEEFAFALRGSLEFRIKTPEGEHRETLSRGDCIYFRSDLPHCFRSLDSQPAESIHVFCPPAVSVDPDGEGASYRAIAYNGRNGSTDVERRVADKLRLLREIHGWSPERVARATGLSERQVLRIERGDRAVPVEVVMTLARAFGKPLREFIGLAGVRAPYYVIQRSKDIPSIPARRRRTPVERPNAAPSKTCQPLVAGFPAKEMYPYFLRLLNVDLETLTHHEHHGQEFIYVLEGELELTTYSGERPVPGDPARGRFLLSRLDGAAPASQLDAQPVLRDQRGGDRRLLVSTRGGVPVSVVTVRPRPARTHRTSQMRDNDLCHSPI